MDVQDNVRMRDLRKIRRAVSMTNVASPPGGPAFPKAFLIGTVIALAVGQFVDWSVWAQLVVFMAAFWAVVALSPHKTFASLIYDLLASYDPKDIGAYQRLQESVAENGLERLALECWLSDESCAIAGPAPIPGERLRFLERKVGPRGQ